VKWILFVLCLGSVSAQVVPMPKKVTKLGEEVSFSNPTINATPAGWGEVLGVFRGALEKLSGRSLGEGEGSTITFGRGDVPDGAAYRIQIGAGEILVTAEKKRGAAQAAATLIQLVRVDQEQLVWKSQTIVDGPDHRYRSFMVDMGRNPHSPETLRQVVDMMWFYKGSFLHLHLTDDQLFSWPSTAYPKLYSKRAGWTLTDFEDLERYSQARGVTIIPEIEVPGHSGILRKNYPEVFGDSPTELASKPEAQKGVETLIDEMLAVFKSTPYIHVGGDEAYGVPKETQWDFINRLNEFVKSRGKRTLVWEGPHPGKGKDAVAKDVIHLPWRSLEFPAQKMLEAGHEIVNASWDPLYIVDHYPKTMFTAVDLERCYQWDVKRFAHINHAFKTFAEPHFTKNGEGILGFCMPWWEGREENLIPLCLHRFAAVASAAWNREGENDFAAYLKRQERALGILEKISNIKVPAIPYTAPKTQSDNLAYRAKVTSSAGAHQPYFGPERLTNGIPAKFDHFLGFPTVPKPLEIMLELQKAGKVGRIVIYERAVGKSHEVYELHVSSDGKSFQKVGHSEKGSRGEKNYVEHRFEPREISSIMIKTKGCQGLTFPSFSRLSEVMAFEN